jgi:neutral amino acid transport system permease protein
MIQFIVFLVTQAAIYAIFSLGLNLQWGYTGLINFGHVAFMTVGAYTTVLLSIQGVPIFIAMLCGGLLAALLGLLLGFSTLRLREDYLGIVTIGVSELIRLLVLNEYPIGWMTRGAQGIQNFPMPLNFTPTYFSKLVFVAIFTAAFGWYAWQLWRWQQRNMQRTIVAGLSVVGGLIVYICGAISLYNYDYRAGLMLLSVLTTAIVYILLEKLVRSPWGRVLQAIREDEEIPKALGKNVFWYKLQSLMLGGAIAGIAGSFYAWQLTNVYPTNFEPLLTFNAWTVVVLGGPGTNLGPILGAIIFWGYDTFTRLDWIKALPFDDARIGAFRIIVIGLILIVITMLRPQGLMGKKDELSLGK